MSVTMTIVESLPLQEHQRAFRLESGEVFVVEITRPELAPAEAAHWVALHTHAFQVDETGVPVTMNGTSVVAPAATRTIPLAALASGEATIDAALAEETTKAAERFRNHLTALRAWQRIPSTPRNA